MLRPLPAANFMLAREASGGVNNAVMMLEPGHPILRDMIAFTTSRPVMAPWWTGRRLWRHRFHKWLGRPKGPEDCQWGVFGPRALSHFVRERGLLQSVWDHHTVYPVPVEMAHILTDPSADLGHYITDRTIAVHLWHNAQKRSGVIAKGPPPGSYMAQAMEIHGTASGVM